MRFCSNGMESGGRSTAYYGTVVNHCCRTEPAWLYLTFRVLGISLADWRTGGLADWRTGGLADWLRQAWYAI